MTEPRSPELDKVILADPEDPAGYQVYGDWLSAQGHPRGELIALQARGLAEPAAAVLAKHAGELWGELAEDLDYLDRIDWHCGFLEAVRIRQPRRHGAKNVPAVADVLGLLLAGAGRFLRDLTVGIVHYESNDYTPITQLLAARGPLPLRRLGYGDFRYEETELNWSTIGDLSPLYPAVPELRRLWLRSGRMQLGTIDLPALRDLEIITGGLDADGARSIATAKIPSIESLDLMFGSDSGTSVRQIEPFAPLLSRSDLPKLHTLAIKNYAFHEELVEALIASPLVAQLRVLDISAGTLGDREAQRLAAARDRFAHLAELVVGSNYLSQAGLDALATIGCKIVSDPVDGPFRSIETNDLGQRDFEDDDDERYTPIYE